MKEEERPSEALVGDKGNDNGDGNGDVDDDDDGIMILR